MKRLLSLVLVLALTLSALPALAEAPEIDKHDQDMIRAAISMTAKMVASAIERDAAGSGDRLNRRFTSIPFMNPLRAVVIDLTKEQAKAMAGKLGTDILGMVRAMGQAVNAPFDPKYAAAADAVYCEREDGPTTDVYSLTLLVYEYELALTLVCPDESRQSVFLIGMKSLATDIDGKYIEDYAASLGVTGVDYALYETAEDVRAMVGVKREIGQNFGFSGMEAALRTSEATMERMLPEVLTVFPPELRPTISRFIGRTDSLTDRLQACRFISEKIDPIVSKVYTGKGDWVFAGTSYDPDVNLPCENLVELTAEPADAPYDPASTILAVYASQRPDEEKKAAYHLLLESPFPADRIPVSLDETDYILLIDTHWELQSKSSSAELYEAITAIILHDAAMGRLVMELGNQTDNYSGMVMVTSKKSYKSIDINKILSLIKEKLF